MAKRNKKDFLPKRVGRFKIPKRIRRGVLGAAIGSAAGQALIAALLLKAGAHVVERMKAAGDPWDDEVFGHPEEAADPPPQGRSAAYPASPPAPPAAPVGPRLNVKHALGQAALAFVVGLAQPKRPKKRRARRSASLPPAQPPGPDRPPPPSL